MSMNRSLGRHLASGALEERRGGKRCLDVAGIRAGDFAKPLAGDGGYVFKPLTRLGINKSSVDEISVPGLEGEFDTEMAGIERGAASACTCVYVHFVLPMHRKSARETLSGFHKLAIF